MSMKNKTIIITGASRGIGRELALRCARDGANIVIAAKSADPHPSLPGTIHTVAEEVEAAGGQALPIQVDVRNESQVKGMVQEAADRFGGIDALVNNAGAISLTSLEHTPLKKFDLIHQINTRAVFLCSQAALPWLKKSDNGHILNLSPSINLKEKWLTPYIPYTVTKYSMSLLTLGMAGEFRRYGIAVNALWPRTSIATAAVEKTGGDAIMRRSRKPAIMADAGYEILSTQALAITGQTLLDEDLLRERGVTDFSQYACDPSQADNLFQDLYVD
ncbi:NAD(P)-dependent oxidoreductase [Kistimonas scapharcae]|uniref:NAD(P)-dependent oxidoreductase n=2 Tax=Kistimonas scapharcae TaxID=1036133 RepID=A0ABP8VAH4_9GAMM